MYLDIDDEVSGKKGRQAVRRSLNTLNLDFPYRGEQRASLVIREHPRHGKDVIFRIEKGQLVCDYGNCTMTVRFGSSDPVRVRATESSSSDSTLFFLSQYDRFIANAKAGNPIIVEATMYQQGSHAMRFETDGFKW